MNFLGPVGLTVAFAWVLGRILIRFNAAASEFAIDPGAAPKSIAARLVWAIDYRLILIGALIPDVIDKPLVFLVNPHFVNSSLRSIGHSLVGVAVMLSLVWVVTRGWQRMPILSFGAALLVHLLFDRIWEMPEVLEWPVRGLVLPMQDIPFSHWYRVHFSQLPTTLPDLIGIALLFLFAGQMIRNRSVIRFFKTGQVS